MSGESSRGQLHGVAWGCWLVAILVLVTLTRNPWVLGMALAWVVGVGMLAQQLPAEGRPALWSPWHFGLVVIPVAALLNTLSVHVGTTVLARLPAAWPLIGGPLTLEAAVYGALNGLALTILYAAFVVFQRAVTIRAIVQLIPRVYYPVAVVAAIALTFVPVTLAQWRQICEAQAVRGHRVRGLRGLLPLWLPLMTGGLERALQLAEAMTARGFAGGAHAPDLVTRSVMLGGLAAALGGLLLRAAWNQTLWGSVVMALGVVSILAALWWVGRRRPHTHYRPMPWRGRDWGVAAGAALTASLCLLPLPGQAALFYSPYPTLARPDFSVTVGVATWGLLVPALVLLLSSAPAQEAAS